MGFRWISFLRIKVLVYWRKRLRILISITCLYPSILTLPIVCSLIYIEKICPKLNPDFTICLFKIILNLTSNESLFYYFAEVTFGHLNLHITIFSSRFIYPQNNSSMVLLSTELFLARHLLQISNWSWHHGWNSYKHCRHLSMIFPLLLIQLHPYLYCRFSIFEANDAFMIF